MAFLVTFYITEKELIPLPCNMRKPRAFLAQLSIKVRGSEKNASESQNGGHSLSLRSRLPVMVRVGLGPRSQVLIIVTLRTIATTSLRNNTRRSNNLNEKYSQE